MHKAAFLDRDGTIVVDKGYVYKPEELEFLENSIEGLKNLQDAGYLIIIITNQSGIARKLFSEEDYLRFMKYLYLCLNERGISIAADYYCKDLPEHKCSCRKPSPLLIKKAAKEYNIDIKKSFFIGDKTSDIEAGRRAGCKTVLLKTGKAGQDGEYNTAPDYICKDLLEASILIRSIR